MEALLDSVSLGHWKHWTPIFRAALHVVLILVLAWVLYRFSHRLIRKFRVYMALKASGTEEVKRIETLARVFRYAASVVIVIVAAMLVLSEVGVSIAPLLGAAGVVGVAVGFGAQSLIKDYFTGLFLLLENQIRQGDVVEIAGKSGEVEEVTLRYMRLRDYEGNVHYIPNGLITTVTNKSLEFSYAVIEIGIAYKENIDEALDIMRDIALALRNDPKYGQEILSDLDIAGLEKIGDSSMTLRARIKVRALQQWDVKREFMKRLKIAYDSQGIELPFPHMTLYAGHKKDGSAPPLNVVSISQAD